MPVIQYILYCTQYKQKWIEPLWNKQAFVSNVHIQSKSKRLLIQRAANSFLAKIGDSQSGKKGWRT